ncbi:MAG TPA: hypothetical protein VK524_11835 [Polyangiaceae bacterium]|nr:hypothetical protein [Polyangiaceae bacterium]
MARRILALTLFSLTIFASIGAGAEEFTRRRLILPDRAFEITGELARPKILGMNMSEDRELEPIYVAPHFYWGASGDVTLGVTHQRGFCLTGEDGGCGDKVYNDAGFAMLANLIDGDAVELDLHVGVPVSSFDPFVIGAKTGVLGKFRAGSLALVFDPYVYVGFNRRDQGNRERVVLPIWFYIQATAVVVPFFGVAFEGPLDGFSDYYTVPVEGGVLFDVTQDIDLGVVMRFHNLLGNDANSDYRELGMLARFRF